MKKGSLLLAATTAAVVAFASVPQINDVAVSSMGSVVRVSYLLSGGPAVVTMDLSTNGVPIPAAALSSARGDVCRIVADGRREIRWRSRGLFGGAYKGNVEATVRAWPLAAPPDYVVFNLGSTSPEKDVRFYADADSVPGGVGAEKYKTTHLLMKKIPAAGKTWHVGLPSSEIFSGSTYGNFASREIYRPVTLTRDYYIGVYEVTQGQCEGRWSFGARTPGGRGTDGWMMKPMNNQRFDDVRGASLGAQWPSEATAHNVDDGSLIKMFQVVTGVSSMDLPTDAQWEVAARGGTWQNHYDGNRNYMYIESIAQQMEMFNLIGWNKYNSGDTVHVVGQKSANPNGLYDIYGNVYELCLDWFATGADLSDGTPQTDPKGPVSGTTRVMRGGGYNGSYSDQSSIGKSSIYPSTQNFATVGLRLACDADFTAFGE